MSDFENLRLQDDEQDTVDTPESQAADQVTEVEPEVQASELPKASSEEFDDKQAQSKKRIGDRLVELGVITADQLNVALQEKKVSGKLLGETLVELGFVTEGALSAYLAEKSGVGVFDPATSLFDGDLLATITKNDAERYKILPISREGLEISVAMSDPYDVVALDVLRRFYGRGVEVKPLVASISDISAAIDRAYGYASSINDILRELEGGEVDPDVSNLTGADAYAHPIVRLVNAYLMDAVKMGASDLHFEPEENFIRLRYRLDGVLFTAHTLHKRHWSGIAQRLKIMSTMNIADKLSPQDGRFSISVGGKDADFRVSSLPTVFGENIVLRVLDQSSGIVPLENLGFSEEQKALIKRIQRRPEGIIVVTGPTGSGKTTTLYSMLNAINSVDVNIQTLEDPVEYSLPMIRQTNVREGVLEFADGIKALLRQDPDIIFVGEIRDEVTAEMALKAAMTGHQVYSSLHTNDSFGVLPRLFDLKLKPGMLAGAMIAAFAQRLVRKLCPNCKVEHVATEEECRILEVDPSNPPTIYDVKQGGCDACGGVGFKGRTVVTEILAFNDEIDEILAAGGSKHEIKTAALRNGFKSMADDGVRKVLEGITTLDAVAKVVNLTQRGG